ncbi:type I-C CRISPR-associated protein Cas8c/Csd1 [Anaerococcus sp. ENR1011]|uniref:Type I-C CRISPR-associated protein Cas8c/Csd1 n=1 Tax=Anaerococcus groningensis TaxID=3115616 RepID=A0ABW9N1C4_9FIRM
MNALEALLNSYNYAENIGLVDNNDYPALLPIYHSKLRSNGTNIIKVEIKKDSSLYQASYLDQYKSKADEENKISDVIIFPVTKDSASRSGRKAPSHALVDKVKYIFNEDGNLLEGYKENLLAWIDFEDDKDIKKFIKTIFDFLDKKYALKNIASNLVSDFKNLNGYDIEYEDKKVDISDVFLEFEISSFIGEKDMSVSSYKNLHKSFIDFTNYVDTPNGVCHISGAKEYITQKHRGLLGNAKLISVSNNKEAYVGRLNKDTSSLKVGRETSEKIHLMLAYLIENNKSHIRIAEKQYLITWFSEDVKNSQNIDITFKKSSGKDLDFLNQLASISSKASPANINTENISQSFKLGKANYSDDSDFYCMIIDSFNPGRVVIKYFNQLKVSELQDNLKKWEDRYNWSKYNENIEDFIPLTPSFYSIFINAYGIERDLKLGRGLDYDNKNFMNNQYVSLVTSLLNGSFLPKNIENKFKQNIRKRNSYKDPRVWNNLLFVARAVLKNSNEENFTRMIDKDNNDRSYLLGRLLSVYHNIELSTYQNKNIIENGEYQPQRLTNAEKFWSNYLDRPATTITILEKKTNTYLNKLKTTDYRMYKGLDKIKSQLLTKISENYKLDDKSFNAPLDYKFLFGYTAQNSSIYGLRNQVNEEREDDKE